MIFQINIIQNKTYKMTIETLKDAKEITDIQILYTMHYGLNSRVSI